MKAATVAEIADSRECRSEPDWPERAALVVRATWSEGERIHRLAQLGHEYAALVALPTGPDAVAKG